MGEGKDTDARVLGAKELDDGDAVGGDKGMLGEIEEVEDGLLGTPAIALRWSVQGLPNLTKTCHLITGPI